MENRQKYGSCCCVVGCARRTGTNGLSEVRMFRFPKQPERREAWATAIRRRGWQPKSHSRICNAHFISGAPATIYDVSNPDWIPSLNMGEQYFTSDGQAGCWQHKRSKKLEKDRLQISCDKLAETAGGYDMADCLEFDQDYQSLHRKLQVKVERETFKLIQDCHPAYGEIQCVTVKEEPDVSPSASMSHTHAFTQQIKEERDDSSLMLCQDVDKFVVMQEGEKCGLAKEDAMSELYGSFQC